MPESASGHKQTKGDPPEIALPCTRHFNKLWHFGWTSSPFLVGTEKSALPERWTGTQRLIAPQPSTGPEKLKPRWAYFW